MVRILVADDDEATRALVSRALVSDGHTITQAVDGHEAAEHIAKTPADFDVVISDVEMPGLGGAELLAAGRAAAPHLRWLMVSGYPHELVQFVSQPQGQVATLVKPFSLDAIKKAVAQLIG